MKKLTLLLALVSIACSSFGYGGGFTPGYGNLGGKGSYIWPIVVGGADVNPLDYDPLQWLFGFTAPVTIEDETTNNITALAVNSACLYVESATTLDIAELTGSETVVTNHGTAVLTIGAGQITVSTVGTVSGLELSNGSIYPCVANSGTTLYDVVNRYDASLGVGAGGESVAYGSLIDGYHYMKEYGGSVIVSFTEAEGTIGTYGDDDTVAVTNDLILTNVRALSDDDTTICYSDTNNLVWLDWAGGDSYQLKYDTDVIIDNVAKGSLFSATVTNFVMGTDFYVGGNSSAMRFDVESITQEGNGGWYASTLKNSFWRNEDSNGADLIKGEYSADVIQYPAVSTSNDVANLGLLNPPNGLHNGGIYMVKQQGAPFELTIRTTGAAETFTMPTRSGYSYDCTADWGDGNIETLSGYDDSRWAHEYATVDDYQISISGQFGGLYFNNSAEADKVITIDNLGAVGWEPGGLGDGFEGCGNLTSATWGYSDAHIAVNTLRSLFRNCPNQTSTFEVMPFTLVASLSDVWSGNTALLTVPDISLMQKVTTYEFCFQLLTSITSFPTFTATSPVAISMRGMLINCGTMPRIDFSNWRFDLVANMDLFLTGSTINNDDYGTLLKTIYNGTHLSQAVDFDAPNQQIDSGDAAAVTARAGLITDGWIINDLDTP